MYEKYSVTYVVKFSGQIVLKLNVIVVSLM